MVSIHLKRFLIFCFTQLIIIRICFFIVSYIRLKLYGFIFWDDDLTSIDLLYTAIINPIYFFIINFILTIKYNKDPKIIYILSILIFTFISIQLSYFNWIIIYRSDDWEHSMIYFLQSMIVLPICGIIGIIEYILLKLIIKYKKNKNTYNVA